MAGRWVDGKGPRLKCQICRTPQWPEEEVLKWVATYLNITCPSCELQTMTGALDGMPVLVCGCGEKRTWGSLL